LAEFFGSELGRRLGLEVAPTEYRELDGAPYLLVERYDRYYDGTTLRRLHQEDFAQALGFPGIQKYEEHGGPSLDLLADLLRTSSARPIEDLGRLRDWQLCNYFIGNYDGHAKNLSLVYPAGETTPRLAPAYDLVCLEFLYRINIRYARTLAFRIDGKATPEEIGRANWEAFATQLGTAPKRLLARLRQMAELLPELARQARSEWAAQYGDNQMLDRFEEAIGDRCKWTLRVVG
jgi:serine/threonine-protein kinase HipA